MLHVANGDHALGVLRDAGLPGDVVAWSDVLDQGPVRGVPGTPEFRDARAQWLAANGAGTLEQVQAQLAAWDSALLTPSDETVLWFEADLTCQLALLHHLVLVDATAVVTQDPVPFQKELAALLQQRRRYDRAQARKAWDAVSAPDPRGIEALDLSGLPPQTGPALRRLLEELPETRSGLSRTERAILEEDASFPRVQAREPVPWITDLFFANVVSALHEAGMFDEPARTDCLEGRLDYRARAADRWVGGVLLKIRAVSAGTARASSRPEPPALGRRRKPVLIRRLRGMARAWTRRRARRCGASRRNCSFPTSAPTTRSRWCWSRARACSSRTWTAASTSTSSAASSPSAWATAIRG